MSWDRAKAYLQTFGMDARMIAFDVSSATVALAAQAIGCREGEIAKTLSFLIGDEPILIVAAGDCKIDNAKYKSQFAAKAKMIPFDQVEARIGTPWAAYVRSASRTAYRSIWTRRCADSTRCIPRAAARTARSVSRSRNWNACPAIADGSTSARLSGANSVDGNNPI